VQAEIEFAQIPVLEPVSDYISMGCVPGGTARNFASYGHKLCPLTDLQRHIGCDPQTSGGLLIAVKPETVGQLESILHAAGIQAHCIGRLLAKTDGPWVTLR
jgi:selenide,water dikinase